MIESYRDLDMEEPVENNFGDHTEFMIQALQLPYSEQMGVSERLRMRKREKKGWARDRLNNIVMPR